MMAPSSTVTPGPKNTFGSIVDVAADLGVGGENTPSRARSAWRRRPSPRWRSALLQHGLGRGELRARC